MCPRHKVVGVNPTSGAQQAGAWFSWRLSRFTVSRPIDRPYVFRLQPTDRAASWWSLQLTCDVGMHDGPLCALFEAGDTIPNSEGRCHFFSPAHEKNIFIHRQDNLLPKVGGPGCAPPVCVPYNAGLDTVSWGRKKLNYRNGLNLLTTRFWAHQARLL